MKTIEIILTNQEARSCDYFLGIHYGKRKKLETMARTAVREGMALQAEEELSNWCVHNDDRKTCNICQKKITKEKQ